MNRNIFLNLFEGSRGCRWSVTEIPLHLESDSASIPPWVFLFGNTDRIVVDSTSNRSHRYLWSIRRRIDDDAVSVQKMAKISSKRINCGEMQLGGPRLRLDVPQWTPIMLSKLHRYSLRIDRRWLYDRVDIDSTSIRWSVSYWGV